MVKTRAIRSHVTSVPLTPGTTVGGGDGLTRVTLVDAGRGRVVPMLLEAARSEPYRADVAIAAAMARDLLADGFGIPDSPGLPEPDLLAFQDYGGIGVMPYAGPDLELSALAALSGDRRVNRDALRQYFSELPDETEGRLPLTRELYLLLGRASLGDASIGEVTLAATRKDLTIEQQVTVALAALAVGDETLARRLYRDILADHGERLGPWVRDQGEHRRDDGRVHGPPRDHRRGAGRSARGRHGRGDHGASAQGHRPGPGAGDRRIALGEQHAQGRCDGRRHHRRRPDGRHRHRR